MNRFDAVRELVKDPSLRVTDIAKQTGYNKGHVSRLRKQTVIEDQIKAAQNKQWTSLTDQELDECYFAARQPDFDVWSFAAEIEERLKEKNT